MQQVDDTVTIDELRLQCQKQLPAGEQVAEAAPDAVVSQRLRKDREHVLEPVSLMARRPNCIRNTNRIGIRLVLTELP